MATFVLDKFKTVVILEIQKVDALVILSILHGSSDLENQFPLFAKDCKSALDVGFIVFLLFWYMLIIIDFFLSVLKLQYVVTVSNELCLI